MLRGPMFASQGSGSNLNSSVNEFQMNMGGPSESTCNKGKLDTQLSQEL
jgi:hypothetical protein